MRHRKRRTRLGRQSAHRIASLANIAKSVLERQRIKTTHAKAKEGRRLVEKLITIAKDDSLAARRRAFRVLRDKTLVRKLFKEIVPLFKDRSSGYTRIIPFNFRKGDGASIVFLELTEKKIENKPKTVKKAKKGKEITSLAGAKPGKLQAAPVISEEAKEERPVEDVKKEKVKKEVRKIEKQKGIFKKMKGFFRRKANM